MTRRLLGLRRGRASVLACIAGVLACGHAGCGGVAVGAAHVVPERLAFSAGRSDGDANAIHAAPQARASLAAAVGRGATGAGVELRHDARLAEVADALRRAGFGAEEMQRRVRTVSWRAGLPDVELRALPVIGAATAGGGAALSQAVFLRARRAPLTHYGLSCDQADCVLVLSSRHLTLEPVSRHHPHGSALRLRGSLLDAGADARVFVELTRPDGLRLRYPCGDRADFDVQIPAEVEGTYQVEIRQRAREAERVVAAFPLRVGDAAAEPSRERGDVAVGLSDEAAARELVMRASAARRNGGLPPFVVDRRLSEVALRSALSLREGRQDVGRTARLRKAGFDPERIVAQSARGVDAAAVHGFLVTQPLSSAQLVRADLTHIGVGVTRDRQGGLVVTELLARLAPPLDVARARHRLLSTLDGAREARGGAALQAAPELQDVAQRAAERFLQTPFPDEQTVVGGADAELSRLSIAYARVTVLLATADTLEALGGFEPVLDGGVTHVGIGLARGDHPRLGVGRLVAVFALGSAR